ncbi:hypothetical protein Taro_047518 [Colocasia esculenta]|uniref:Uncharacterized protein n=1 Tax=Colocasia esculenta TaxID=4460 RepID=A0A843X111_COLES|nr:hypothetical protein [Colocasia esculenta]
MQAQLRRMQAQLRRMQAQLKHLLMFEVREDVLGARETCFARKVQQPPPPTPPVFPGARPASGPPAANAPVSVDHTPMLTSDHSTLRPFTFTVPSPAHATPMHDDTMAEDSSPSSSPPPRTKSLANIYASTPAIPAQSMALSIRALRGDLVSAFPCVTTLELKIELEEPAELLANYILSALRACNKLIRTLVLSIMMEFHNSDSDDETESPRVLLALDSDIVMRDLKTIMIQGLTRYNHHLGEEGSTEAEGFVAQKGENDIVLIGFLLKVSPVLEKLIVQPSKGMYMMARKWELLFNLSSVLLSLPRASPNAKVFIDGK